ncbi:hypothetical protein SELMODRAFT_432082 [Selaginella moellendorffii]|uniref:Uncharacterized protein n=1 Tax=Selaginella moellendorffii TaxID=88036 RepID=D8TEX7_SELML|nr:hypothetical protein SELMODRAFT_432082 [Selaginella moellendorffii]
MARAMEQRALGRGRSDRAARRQASGSGAHGISRGRGGFDVGKPHARSLGPLLRIDQLPRIANYVLGAVVLVEARGKPDRRRRSFRRSWHEEGGERKEMEQERALPREALCRTPRLTPWLTLLPCRDKAGLTTLLDRQTIYSGMYHSQRLLITSGDFDRDEEGTTLEQVVFRKLQDWRLSSMFGSKLVGKCPLATTSSVYLELEESLAKHLAGDLSEETGINFADSRVFSLSPAPSRVLASSSGSLFLAHTASSAPVDWSPARAQFYTSWYLAGSGNARGSIVISFRANDGSSRDCYSPGIEAGEDDTEVCSFEWPHATGAPPVAPPPPRSVAFSTLTLCLAPWRRDTFSGTKVERFRAVLGASTPHIHHPFLSRTGNSILRQLKWTKFSMCLVGLGESNKPAFSPELDTPPDFSTQKSPRFLRRIKDIY